MQKFRFFAFAIPAAMSLLLGCDPEPVRPFDLQGHRGARAVLPENSVPGFVFANALGVTTLELDLVVTAAHAAGVRVVPWTVNDVERMAELVAWGVDGLITDDPEAALEVLAALRPGL